MLLKLAQFVLMGVFLIVYVSIKYPAGRPIAAPKPPSIEERQVNGFVERTTGWWILHGFPTMEGQNVDWSAVANSDPSKPRLVFAVRSRTPKDPTWLDEEYRWLTLIADERPIKLRGERHEYRKYGILHSVIEFSLTEDDLSALANANTASIKFAGQRCEIISRGLQACRELQMRCIRGQETPLNAEDV